MKDRLLWFTLAISGIVLAVAYVVPTVYADPVSGVVVDCKGNPISGSSVTMYKVEGSSERPIANATTNGSGVFEFNPISKGTYNVLAICPDGGRAVSTNFDVPGTASHALKLVCCAKTSSASTSSNAQVNSEQKTAGGLTTVTFTATAGRIKVNLPDDMMAGDTISGTVVAEPKGQNEAERSKNMGELTGLVIDIAPPKKPDGTDRANVRATVAAATVPFVINLPPIQPPVVASSSDSDTVVIRLTNTNGSISTGGTATVPIEMVSLSLQSVTPLNTFQLPKIGQQGRPTTIIGPFDGNITNTKLMYGPAGSSIQDFEKNTENVTGGFGLLQPLAESPRKCVVEAPVTFTGPVQLFVKDGKTETTAPYRNVGVKLTAPKTNLLKGERTTLTVQVTGLQGIKEPVPLTLESHGVITIEGGMYQALTIQPSQVGEDGRYTTTRGITGVQTGGWTSTATVVTQKAEEEAKKKPEAPGTTPQGTPPGGVPQTQPSPRSQPSPTPQSSPTTTGQPGASPSPQLGTMPTACATLRDEADRLKEEIKKKEDELAGLPAEKQKTAAELDKCKSELAKAKEAQKKAAAELANQERRKKNIEKNIGPGKTFPDKDAAKKNFGDYEKDYDDAKKAKDDADQKVADAQKKCDELKKKPEDLAAKEKSLPGEIEELKRKLEDVLKKLGEWQSEEEKKKQEVEEKKRQEAEKRRRTEAEKAANEERERAATEHIKYLLSNMKSLNLIDSSAFWENHPENNSHLIELLKKTAGDLAEEVTHTPIPLDTLDAIKGLYGVVAALLDPCTADGKRKTVERLQSRINPNTGRNYTLEEALDKTEGMCDLLQKLKILASRK